MPDTKYHSTLLYFEDEPGMAKMVGEFLAVEGYRVIHLDGFPEEGVAAIEQLLPKPPDVVLMDVRLAGLSGYEICQQLREGYLPETTPVLFISGLMQTEDILQAYKSGADDYLIKPIRLAELSAKLAHYTAMNQRQQQASEQMNSVRKIAMAAMTTSSELGEMLRFYEDIVKLPNLTAIGHRLLQTISPFDVRASIQFWKPKPLYISDDHREHKLEIEVMRLFRDSGRIYHWKNRTFFNYEYFSVLIRNMPVQDAHRYGVLNDQFCLLLNGLDGVVRGVIAEQHNNERQKVMTITASTLARMVMEMDRNNVNLSERFEQIILDMEGRINQDILKFNLLHSEEQVLLDHIRDALGSATEIFESSLAIEKNYRETMTRLLETLGAEHFSE